MPLIVHHRPVDTARTYKIHAWDGTTTWDLNGTASGNGVDFALPEPADARKLRFLFHAVDPQTHKDTWEPDDFIRRPRLAAPGEIWSFDYAARILYQAPQPPDRTFQAGDVLTVNVVTQKRFKGGRLYAWNPYGSADGPVTVAESSRNDPVSTFQVPLASWMTRGFHFKLVATGTGGKEDWEPEGSNRVWRPCDGNTLWIKSGQVSVRSQPLELTPLPVEVLYPASIGSAPNLDLLDPAEGIDQLVSGTAAEFGGSALFRVASYAVPIYPDAAYELAYRDGAEGTPALTRPFPADPDDLTVTSRFIFGAAGWVQGFPALAASLTLVVEPRPATSFAGGLTIQIGVGRAPAHDHVPATLAPDGTWQAKLTAVPTVANWVRLVPAAGDEPKPYDWIDVRRFFTPAPGPATYFTAEGVYGLTTRGKLPFADPPSRAALMQAAFGQAAAAPIFGPNEMPHGPTLIGTEVTFVLHAPHAAWAALVLIEENAANGPIRKLVPMNLTGDTLYWWCQVPASEAPPGSRYRFALNDAIEVMDPAAREVFDSGNFQTSPARSPRRQRLQGDL